MGDGQVSRPLTADGKLARELGISRDVLTYWGADRLRAMHPELRALVLKPRMHNSFWSRGGWSSEMV